MRVCNWSKETRKELVKVLLLGGLELDSDWSRTIRGGSVSKLAIAI